MKFGKLFKIAVVSVLVSVFCLLTVTEAFSCTGVYVGKDASADGTTIIARSNDIHPDNAYMMFKALKTLYGDVLRNIMYNTDTLQYVLDYDTLQYEPKEATPLKLSVDPLKNAPLCSLKC